LPFICYVHRVSGGVPHFEVLPDHSRDGAIERAAAILAQRPDGHRAEVWEEDVLVFTLTGAAKAEASAAWV
jgi:hypothetical protein